MHLAARDRTCAGPDATLPDGRKSFVCMFGGKRVRGCVFLCRRCVQFDVRRRYGRRERLPGSLPAGDFQHHRLVGHGLPLSRRLTVQLQHSMPHRGDERPVQRAERLRRVLQSNAVSTRRHVRHLYLCLSSSQSESGSVAERKCDSGIYPSACCTAGWRRYAARSTPMFSRRMHSASRSSAGVRRWIAQISPSPGARS